jgi:DNA ligase (NAD+)
LETDGKSVVKGAANLLAAIAASKSVELWRFIYGLGIPQVGPAAARELARKFGSLDALGAGTERSGSGGETAVRAANKFFASERNRTRVADLVAAGVRPTAPATDPMRASLVGKTFVLTGALPTLTRAQAAAKIESAGGKVASSVSRHTHWVVAGSDPGAKLDQARALGVVVIDEPTLRRMLGEE